MAFDNAFKVGIDMFWYSNKCPSNASVAGAGGVVRSFLAYSISSLQAMKKGFDTYKEILSEYRASGLRPLVENIGFRCTKLLTVPQRFSISFLEGRPELHYKHFKNTTLVLSKSCRVILLGSSFRPPLLFLFQFLM